MREWEETVRGTVWKNGEWRGRDRELREEERMGKKDREPWGRWESRKERDRVGR